MPANRFIEVPGRVVRAVSRRKRAEGHFIEVTGQKIDPIREARKHSENADKFYRLAAEFKNQSLYALADDYAESAARAEREAAAWGRLGQSIAQASHRAAAARNPGSV